MERRYVCAYGASSTLLDSAYYVQCEKLGMLIAEHGYALCFGGGTLGVMGALVRGTKKAGGHALGIAPKFFDTDGILHKDCDEFLFTETMGERKALLTAKSHAFVVCPGGIGTLDEFFDILTLKQLGVYDKPLVIFNLNGCYDALISLLQGLVRDNFSGADILSLFKVANTAEEVMAIIDNGLN